MLPAAAPARMVVMVVVVRPPAVRDGPRPRPRRRHRRVVVPALAAGVGPEVCAAAGLRARADDPPEQEDADDGANDDAGDGAAAEA